MKKWVSAAILLLLTVLTRGLALLFVVGAPVALDVMTAINRDRRYKFVPWSVTRGVYRWLFISPAPPAPPPPVAVSHYHHGVRHEHVDGHVPHQHAEPPVIPGPPPPTGERHSRYIPNDVKAAVAARDMGRCRQCNSMEEIQFDHVIPWSRGGKGTVGNIQLLCGPCNRRKSDR